MKAATENTEHTEQGGSDSHLGVLCDLCGYEYVDHPISGSHRENQIIQGCISNGVIST